MSSFDAVKREIIRRMQENGVSLEGAEGAISGLDEEGLLQRMCDARDYSGGVDELGAMKRRADLDNYLNRVTAGVFSEAAGIPRLEGLKKSEHKG